MSNDNTILWTGRKIILPAWIVGGWIRNGKRQEKRKGDLLIKQQYHIKL